VTPKATGGISATVDMKALARADKRLAGYMGRPLQRRAQQAYIEGARLMVGPMRSKMDASGVQKRSGKLRRSIRANNSRLRPGEMAAATVGPTAPHRHLIVRGHRIVTRGRRDTGRRSQAFPFVDATYADMGDQVTDYIATRTLAVTGETFRSF
jgi:hypothetical protein